MTDRPRLNARWLWIPTAEAAVSAIICLLRWRRPSAVARLIAAVVVNSIYRVPSGRAPAHVAQEREKIVTPLRTDCDAAAPVFGVVRIFRIETAALNSRPRFKFRRLAEPVCPVCLGRSRRLRASTSECSAAKVALPDASFIATIAEAQPAAMPGTDAINFTQHNEFSESLAGEVFLQHLGILQAS